MKKMDYYEEVTVLPDRAIQGAAGFGYKPGEIVRSRLRWWISSEALRRSRMPK